MLTFADFSEINVRRCTEAFGSAMDEWSETDWATAVAGEVGEACNLIKKRRRGQEVEISEVGKELADAVTYIDLLATRLGLDLGTIVAEKFNEVSDRVGSRLKIKICT